MFQAVADVTAVWERSESLGSSAGGGPGWTGAVVVAAKPMVTLSDHRASGTLQFLAFTACVSVATLRRPLTGPLPRPRRFRTSCQLWAVQIQRHCGEPATTSELNVNLK